MEKGFYSSNQFRELAADSRNQSFAIEPVTGNTCQLNCEPCYKNERLQRTKNDRIPTEDAKDYITQAKENSFKEIVLIGGEPTLHGDIFELIRHVKQEELSPILCTNGIVFGNERQAQRLEGTGTTVVTHAFFPDGEEIIDRYSGKRGYAKILQRAIDNLINLEGIDLVLEMPLNDTMFAKAFEFFKFCREKGVIPFIEISRHNDNGKKTTNVTPEQVRELFERFKEYDEKHFPSLKDAILTPPAYGNKCTMSITGLHVKNHGHGDYGKVYSCCAQSIVHGDLKKDSLREIMKSPTLSVFRDQDNYIVGPCKECDVYDLCRGGCRGEAYLKFGCPRASCPSCDRISEETRNDITLMAPESCEGCPLEKNPDCCLKK